MAAWKDWDSSEKHQNSAKCLKEHDKQIKDNRNIWSTTTNIAQGGHDESAESDNWGSFIAVLETTAKHDKTLKKKGLYSIHHAKYTSKAILNEVLSCLADMVWTKVTEEVKQSKVFSVMADETRHYKKKQISWVLRYYYSKVFSILIQLIR